VRRKGFSLLNVHVSNWDLWNKRKRQASWLLLVGAFGLGGKMETSGQMGYGYLAVLFAIFGASIFSTTYDAFIDWDDS
jgi:hypothetical protein